MRLRFAAIALLTLITKVVIAEENCGSMVRRPVRFRAPIVLLEAEVMDCDGQFRRVVSVRRPDKGVQDFAGWLEVGRTYRANVRWTSRTLSSSRRLRVPARPRC